MGTRDLKLRGHRRQPPIRHPALTTEVAEVHVRLQPSDQGVDVRVVELQALQEGDGPILSSSLQQMQQVPSGGTSLLTRHWWAGGNPCISGSQQVKAVPQDPGDGCPSPAG